VRNDDAVANMLTASKTDVLPVPFGESNTVTDSGSGRNVSAGNSRK